MARTRSREPCLVVVAVAVALLAGQAKVLDVVSASLELGDDLIEYCSGREPKGSTCGKSDSTDLRCARAKSSRRFSDES